MGRGRRFALVDREAHDEMVEADDLEEIAESVAEKAGLRIEPPEVDP